MFYNKKHRSPGKPVTGLALVLLILLYLTSILTCTKDEPRLMKVLNDSIAEISVSTAKIYITVVDIGEGIDKYGHCWSKAEDFTLENCEKNTSFELLSEPDTFVHTITGLNANSRYYIKAYLKRGSNTVYSNLLNFHTLVPTKPKVSTGEADTITINSIVMNGTIENTGLTATGIIDHGHCFSKTNQMPTVADDMVSLGPRTTPGNFKSTLQGLSSKTIYYIRAYATNEADVDYGEQKIITTASAYLDVSPNSKSVSTTANSTTFSVSTNVEWSVSDDASWLTATKTDASTISVSYNENTSASSRTANITATGTGGVNEIVTLTQNGATPYIAISPSGKTVNSASSSITYSVSTNVVSWSVSDDASWLTATKTDASTISVSYNENTFASSRTANITATGTGGVSKTVTLTQTGAAVYFDVSPNSKDVPSTSGSTAFTVSANTGWSVTDDASWLTATKISESTINVSYDANTITVSRTANILATVTGGFSETVTVTQFGVTTTPTVVTTTVSAVTATSATSGGTVTDDGGMAVTARGVCYSKTSNPTVNDQTTNQGGGTGYYTSPMTGLEPLTTYHVKAYATNANGTAYGSEVPFTTDFNCGAQFIDPRDGKHYNTRMIGDQCWMAQNLNIGTLINVTEDQTDNSLIEKYCYDNMESNCDIYGGIYQWDEMMQYTLIESAQGVCPSGWHIPSDYEWKVMEIAIGMSPEAADSFNYRGTNEGGKLKIPYTTYWESPNTGATNSTWFTALPAGWVNDKGFLEIGQRVVFWTSTPTIPSCSWYRSLAYDHSEIYRRDGYRPSGTSVRCIRDQ